MASSEPVFRSSKVGFVAATNDEVPDDLSTTEIDYQAAAKSTVEEYVMKSTSGHEWIDIVGKRASKEDFVNYLLELAQRYKLHPATVEDCLSSKHLPKTEKIDNIILIITRYCEPEAPPDGSTVQDLTNKMVILVSQNRTITIHRAEIPSIQKMRQKWQDTWSKKSQEHVLNKLLTRILDSYNEALAKASDAADELERMLLERSANTNETISKLYLLKRKSSVFKRMLALTRDIITNYSRHAKSLFGATAATVNSNGELEVKSAATLGFNNDGEDPYRQHLIDRVHGIIFRADELHENSVNLLNLYMGLISQRTNEMTTVLTTFSVFFIPLTFLAGIYGMNFEHMPELKWVGSYPLLLCVMLMIALSLFAWLKTKQYI